MQRPSPDDYLRRWPVSKRVNTSKADADDVTLIDPIKMVDRTVVSTFDLT
jgi:hypothetical protein